MKKYIFGTLALLLMSGFVGSVVSATIAPPPQLPTTKAQCKDGGWQDFGTMFKNQGDCVSFVATGGKN